MTLEQRLVRLESGSAPGTTPGTNLGRTFREPKNAAPVLEWTLAVGGMGSPKTFYHGATIEEVVSQAERDLGLDTARDHL